ncbi:hypothetical protein [Micromonospora rhizosphaerae]|uniref:hypothetical protein n=1 Tax=Micromonospora rhizosphaerae TaxID=568872 RepID=UPI001FE060A7|nr:hypothetical protein [Micromonospora rhizosphaerae]
MNRTPHVGDLAWIRPELAGRQRSAFGETGAGRDRRVGLVGEGAVQAEVEEELVLGGDVAAGVRVGAIRKSAGRN